MTLKSWKSGQRTYQFLIGSEAWSDPNRTQLEPLVSYLNLKLLVNLCSINIDNLQHSRHVIFLPPFRKLSEDYNHAAGKIDLHDCCIITDCY